jgi:hypothetical protein
MLTLLWAACLKPFFLWWKTLDASITWIALLSQDSPGAPKFHPRNDLLQEFYTMIIKAEELSEGFTHWLCPHTQYSGHCGTVSSMKIVEFELQKVLPSTDQYLNFK